MSDKPYRPALDDCVRIKGSDEKWIVLKTPRAVGGYVVGPADGGTARRLVPASECEPWTDAPRFDPNEIEAASQAPPTPPPWLQHVLDNLVADWLAEWERQPEMFRGIELGSSLAALVASRWVLAADPEQVAELAGNPHSDPRPEAIATLAGVVLPFGLQRIKPQQQPT